MLNDSLTLGVVPRMWKDLPSEVEGFEKSKRAGLNRCLGLRLVLWCSTSGFQKLNPRGNSGIEDFAAAVFLWSTYELVFLTSVSLVLQEAKAGKYTLALRALSVIVDMLPDGIWHLNPHPRKRLAMNLNSYVMKTQSGDLSMRAPEGLSKTLPRLARFLKHKTPVHR